MEVPLEVEVEEVVVVGEVEEVVAAAAVGVKRS